MSYVLGIFGEVPKMAEGTPLERVQVVDSGARVQIPPSPEKGLTEVGPFCFHVIRPESGRGACCAKRVLQGASGGGLLIR